MESKNPEYLRLNHEMLPKVSEADYLQVQPYIDAAQAMAQLTYKSVYIIDYARMNFLYVSENPLFLAGRTATEIQELGYSFYAQSVPEDDFLFLTHINQAGFDFFRNIPIYERKRYSISYNFHLQIAHSKEYIFINHQLTPLVLDSEGNIWLALCLVSLAPTEEKHTAYISAANSHKTWQFTMERKRWKLYESIELTESEKAVIQLANQGFSVGEIASKIHRSEDSVKGYRKKLFAKLGVKSISEAISVATHRKLI
ncbi:MAG: helix-turn-helix transcriptional regulator [Phocaeicola sp.]|nr:helix-turn-helix transcriptional regulator [Phocaeicola sp.]MDD7449003.1 helix-turn-helix transcriptional regulator [Prevotellaceae bacterium]MDY5939070.1 helix-turn-helix transcriptional regulator [Phocaeicola sp.]